VEVPLLDHGEVSGYVERPALLPHAEGPVVEYEGPRNVCHNGKILGSWERDQGMATMEESGNVHPSSAEGGAVVVDHRRYSPHVVGLSLTRTDSRFMKTVCHRKKSLRQGFRK
jgi:hypothetical protein